ncbi:24424_t:CDS:1, partial [Cetraspora pellucida]
PNIDQKILLQQMPAIIICNVSKLEDLPVSNFTFEYLFSTRSIQCNFQATKTNKTIYAELFGLSKKVIDSAIQANASQKLFNTLKSLLYDMQNQINKNQSIDYSHTNTINNPTIVKHKG